MTSPTSKKKQGKRLSEIERSEIISLKQNSQLSDMKIALRYNVDRSTITKIMNKVKKEAIIDSSLSQSLTNSVPITGVSQQRIKRKPPPPTISKEEAAYAKKLKLIEESLSDWRESTLNGQVSISNDSLKQKALDIFNLLKEKTATTSEKMPHFKNDWRESDYESFNVMNSCDESNF